MNLNVLPIGQVDPSLERQIAHSHNARRIGHGDLQSQVIQQLVRRCDFSEVESCRIKRVGGTQDFEVLVNTFDDSIDVLAESARKISRILNGATFSLRSLLRQMTGNANPDQSNS